MTRGLLSQFLVAALLAAAPAHDGAQAQSGVRKQVFLIIDGDRLVASNVRRNGFDELRLGARERMLRSEEGEGVIIVVTNQRLLAYGAATGWSERDRDANESVESLSAVDYAGLIVTNKRMLNFNGQTGSWGEQKRRTGN